MSSRTSKQVCKDALEAFGLEAQINMCVEECAELTNALMKFRRGRATLEEVQTEIADVQIMCEQMSIAFGDKQTLIEHGRKLARLADRIDEHQVKIKVKESALKARKQ